MTDSKHHGRTKTGPLWALTAHALEVEGINLASARDLAGLGIGASVLLTGGGATPSTLSNWIVGGQR